MYDATHSHSWAIAAMAIPPPLPTHTTPAVASVVVVVLEYIYGDRTEQGRWATCSVVGAMSATRSVVDTASTMYDANPGAPRPFRNGAMESDRP